MEMTEEQLNAYERDGFVLVPNCFSSAEIEVMKAELPTLFAENSPRRVDETGGRALRSVYGSHTTNEVFRRLSQHPFLVETVRELLHSEVYIYQFKINAKVAFDGDVWDWHQDYVFWLKEDGMPAARVVNVALFLDDVNEFNGPMFLIPGSHREGMIDVPPMEDMALLSPDESGKYEPRPDWITNLTAKIKYSVNRDDVERLVAKYGIVAPKGQSGSVLFFNSNIVHASPPNISPFNRVIVFITYNSIENIPTQAEKVRPDFLSSRNSEPIVPLPEDTLIALRASETTK